MKLTLALILASSVFSISYAEQSAEESHEPKILKLEVQAEPNRDLATPAVAPKIESPEFFATVSPQNVTLKWEASPGADFYHFQLATDPNFKWLVVNEPLYNKTEYTASNLEPAKHYFWRVAGVKSQNKPGYLKGFFSSSMFQTPK